MNKYNSRFYSKFISVLKFIFLFVTCILAAIILVWPFWKFSTSLPKVYTSIILAVIFAFLLYLIIKKIIRSNKKNVLKFFVNLVVILGGLAFSIYFVLFDKKMSALIIFLSMIFMQFCLLNMRFYNSAFSISASKNDKKSSIISSGTSVKSGTPFI